jgi:hypothetical protein
MSVVSFITLPFEPEKILFCYCTGGWEHLKACLNKVDAKKSSVLHRNEYR